MPAQEENGEEAGLKVNGYDFEEIEEGWWEYLNKPAEERERLRDPFIYRDRDLHLNPCLRVVPDNFKEKPKKHKDCEQDFLCNFLKRKRAEYEKMYQWTAE
ncbi:hypothetical protein TNCT_587371 [Trichonephila clavata]|uniref:Uncharacterized protein n=1 Tax=Trichonephila clavata TaxID=2740835 RepID=A0A8X6GV75_TRICU|nr:hypothetical protein TNCT_587371 [Trichonephila clavata]